MRAIVLTVASGALYGACFPTWSLQSLAWVALVPFLLALRDATARGAVGLAWLWTLAAAATLGDWFPGAIANYYRQSFAVGLGFFLGVSSLMAAPYYLLFALWYRRVAVTGGWAVPVLTGAAWVGAELARARLGGNPWALFGYSQVGRDALTQIADVTSVYGTSFALVVVNAAVAEVVAALRAGRRVPLAGAAVAAAVALALPVYAALRPTTLAAASGPPVAVAVVQGNVDVGTLWSEELYGQNLDVYLRLTADLLRRDGAPALVIWPENGLTFFLESEPAYRAVIARVLAPAGVELLAGGPRTVVLADGPAFYNSMFLVAPDGAIRERYDKQHLVPFGERFPIPSVAVLARRFERVRALSAGPFAAPIPTAAGRAGIMICSEAMFPEIAAARVRDGAELFVDPAHDTWLTPKFSAQQFDIVRLRTIEQRRWLARASTSGPSAIVDPLGHVTACSDFFTQAALSGTIEPRSDVTLYQRVGDTFAAMCLAAALMAARGAPGKTKRRN